MLFGTLERGPSIIVSYFLLYWPCRCRQSLPRPEWEQGFFYMMSFSLLLLLVTSLLLSYFDMRRIFSESLARRLQRGQTFLFTVSQWISIPIKHSACYQCFMWMKEWNYFNWRIYLGDKKDSLILCLKETVTNGFLFCYWKKYGFCKPNSEMKFGSVRVAVSTFYLTLNLIQLPWCRPTCNNNKVSQICTKLGDDILIKHRCFQQFWLGLESNIIAILATCHKNCHMQSC